MAPRIGDVRDAVNPLERIERISYERAYGQPFDDLPRRVPKLDKIRLAIGFAPRFSLEQIIKSVIEDHRLV
jgi:UDP-glucose 4-epimerase